MSGDGGARWLVLLLAAIPAGLVALWVDFYYWAVPAALDRWAAGAGYRILRKEHRTFFKGPFFWTTSRSQVVYRVLVEGPKGEKRQAWVRIGGFWWPWTRRIEVRWDPPPASPAPQTSARGKLTMWDRELDA